MKKLLLMALLIIVVLLLAAGCKKASRDSFVESVFPDTSSMSVDLPEDSTANGDFKLTDYDTPPVPIKNPMPAYPVKFRKSGIQGVVVLDVEVLADGTVGEISVMKSLLPEPGALDETAVNTVKSWIFKPALQNKKPVVSHVNIPVPFQLKQ